MRIPLGFLLDEVTMTELIRRSLIFFVAVVTVSDDEHVATLQKEYNQREDPYI